MGELAVTSLPRIYWQQAVRSAAYALCHRSIGGGVSEADRGCKLELQSHLRQGP